MSDKILQMDGELDDIKDRYKIQNPMLANINDEYFDTVLAFDTNPAISEPHCYIIIPSQLGAIYQPLIERIKFINFGQIELSSLQHVYLNYLRKANKVLTSFYCYNSNDNQNQHKILNMLFGPNYHNYADYFKNKIYSYPQPERMGNAQFIEEVYKNNQKFKHYYRFKKRGQNHIKSNQQLQKLLDGIPYQADDCRLQPLIQMSRRLSGIFGVEVTGTKLNANKFKKVYIKSNLLVTRKCNRESEPTHYNLWNSANVEYIKNLQHFIIAMKNKKQTNYAEYRKLHQMHLQHIFKQICELLIQIEIVTGQPYPNLKGQNIMFYNHQLRPALSINPYILQALGFNHKLSQKAQQDWQLANFIKQSTQNKLLEVVYHIQNLNKFKSREFEIKKQISVLTLIRKKQQQNDNQQMQKCLSNNILYNSQKNFMRKLLNIITTKVPSLITINHQLKLNSHVSDLTPKKYEYVLWMRYKVMKFMLQITQNQLRQIKLKKSPQKQTNKDIYNKIDISVQFIVLVTRLLLCLTIKQLREVLRQQEDKYMIKQIQQFQVQHILNQIKIKLSVSNNILDQQRTALTKQMFVILNQLQYLQNSSKQIMFINYSKSIKMLLKQLLKQQQFKDTTYLCYQIFINQKQQSLLYHFAHIYHITILIMIKMDHRNIFQCDHFYYRKLKYMTQKQIKLQNRKQIRTKLNKMRQSINKFKQSQDCVWSGSIWPEHY